MKEESQIRPDYIFEVSWEVCNKVGGIHTVISTKALTLVNEWEDHIIMIGPDVWKGTGEHPEFHEDFDLFHSWKPHIEERGLKIRIGRWKIPGNPIVILVDYTTLFQKKDEIFSELWLNYKVDSLTGQWDYIEPALFGYAAGMVIECFYFHYITLSDKIVAQFHEWMTGAGLLYLELNVPQIGSIFTTHATATGRSIAGNNLPLYGKLSSYDGEHVAKQFNIISKHSLEKTAAEKADCFTTVSEVTARECEILLGKKPDIVTPNGFEASIVPDAFLFREKRSKARTTLLKVASAITEKTFDDDTLLILKSGRYEFRNKGVDIFIDALGELNKNKIVERNIVAFIFIPANQTGPCIDLLEKLNGANIKVEKKTITHYLQGAETDPIIQRMELRELKNELRDQVTLLFAPIYLDGSDGIFNLPYYDILIGFDLSVFPSYYEPWGYTPMESLAFHVPTITTSVTGFGMLLKESNEGAYVVERNDNNDVDVRDNIVKIIQEFANKKENEIKSSRGAACTLSKKALWKNLITFYKTAFSLALQKTEKREAQFAHPPHVAEWDSCPPGHARIKAAKPLWRKVFVKSELPQSLRPLQELTGNIWWTWNSDAEDLLANIDPALWEKCEHNPVELLSIIPHTQIDSLSTDKAFLEKLSAVMEAFRAYLKQPLQKDPCIAYFCMEYGLHNSLKLYSGGLGVLAGDYLKQASDAGENFIAIGLLYRNGYFRQRLSIYGDQQDFDDRQKFTSLPLHPVLNPEGDWVKITIPFPGHTLYAKAWRIDVGRIPLFLLDTDIHDNPVENRHITSRLYGGDNENRLKQEILLGIGGVRLLYLLDIKPDIYHFNEGHSAFAGIERIYHLILDEKLSYQEALEINRSSSLFTTHTPVEAGHDTFSEAQLRFHFSHYAHAFNISWKEFMDLGKATGHENDPFSMSYLATHLTGEINGVSFVHQQVTRKMFNVLWPGYLPTELRIGHVTNGVHTPTWISPKWKSLNQDNIEEGIATQIDPTKFSISFQNFADKEIWAIHLELKRKLLQIVKKQLQDVTANRRMPQIQKMDLLNEHTFLIGFARRFVPYKRSDILFHDLKRLSDLLNDTDRPVVFIFSGKAHPQDVVGQQLLKNILATAALPTYQGKIIFLENYDLEKAHYLVQGVDLWLNTPVQGMEASGTSGMKAAFNGVLNLSILDGWWAEAFKENIGWGVSNGNSQSGKSQDEYDAANLHHLLKNEIIPLYFSRDKDGLPIEWIKKMKNAVKELLYVYSTERMLKEYREHYYQPMQIRQQELRAAEFDKIKKLATWKKKIYQLWDGIRIVSIKSHDFNQKPFPAGETMETEVILNLNGIDPTDVGVEIIFTNRRLDEVSENKIIMKQELNPTTLSLGKVRYSALVVMQQQGVFEYSFRIFPKNPLWPLSYNSELAKWI